MGTPAVKLTQQTRDDFILPDAAPVNILIVDDLPEKLLVYETILEDMGQNLMMARSGEEALKLVLKHEFAVILLDVNMPSMNGFETAELIRSRKKSAKTPIIFLTAFTDELSTAQVYATGAVDYLPTPVLPEVLRAKIRVFIELFQMRHQAAAQAEERAKREAAEEADRRKDEFLATLAHELRNPLAPLHNALHLLQMSEPDPETIKRALEIMQRQLQQMVRLVDDLMDVSRITQGKIDLRLEYISLQDAIESALETTRPLIETRQHRLQIDLPAHPITVKADLIRLSQIFANLLNNAAKYTDPGGLITLSVEPHKDKVTIRVQDTGIGIEKNKLPQVFDLFLQIDSSLTRAQGGLGIGLTVVKNLVEMQKGTIEVLSEGLNKGSSFIVELPVFNIEESRKENNQSALKPDITKVSRILIVDDNEASANTLGWMMEILGHETALAFNGPQALEMAKTFQPQLVLLDIGLPKMSGYEVCEAMREIPSLQKTIFVAQTGWGQAEHRRLSKEAGFDYHLVKPIKFESLQDILATIPGA
jgi:signal transduction histidine kinase